jgi:hypothetical protein
MVKKPKQKISLHTAARAVVDSLPQSKHLTIREKERVAGVIAGERMSDAPVAIQSPILREAIVAAISKLGVGVEYIAQHVKDGLEANRLSQVGEGPDWGSRHKYFTSLLELMEPKEKEGNGSPSRYKSMLHGDGEIIDVTPPKEGIVQRRMASQKPRNRGGK